MSRGIFCLLFSFVDYVPVKGEIIQQPKCPSANEWIKKLWYIYTMEFYAVERKKELIPFATFVILGKEVEEELLPLHLVVDEKSLWVGRDSSEGEIKKVSNEAGRDRANWT